MSSQWGAEPPPATGPNTGAPQAGLGQGSPCYPSRAARSGPLILPSRIQGCSENSLGN